jgi:hypothetical protein
MSGTNLFDSLMIRPPPFRHCETPTRTIRHCNDLLHKRLQIEAIRPHKGRTVRLPQTARFDPLEVGLNVGCDNPIHG